MIIAPAFLSHLIETFPLNLLLLFSPKTQPVPRCFWDPCELLVIICFAPNLQSCVDKTISPMACFVIFLGISKHFSRAQCEKISNYHRSHQLRRYLLEAGWIWCPRSADQVIPNLRQEKCSIFIWTGGIYPPPHSTITNIGSSIHSIPANQL